MQDANTHTQEGRARVFDDLSDLFLADGAELSAPERAILFDILTTLIHDVEVMIRVELVDRMADLGDVPHDLVVAMANMKIEIARPLLMRSSVLNDPDLIQIVRERGREHQLSITQRSAVSEIVSDALVELGDATVIEQLLKNPDAEISHTAYDYLVAESRRVERFRQPLISRGDLPPVLAHRMFWWVSDALRRQIVETYSVDDAAVQAVLTQATKTASAKPARSSDDEAERLVARLGQLDELTERFLVQALRSGRVAVFVAGMAKRARVETRTMRRVVFDTTGEPLAIACHALHFTRQTFATLFLLTHQGKHAMRPDRFERVLEFFDRLDERRTRSALHFWRLDAEYLGNSISEPGDLH